MNNETKQLLIATRNQGKLKEYKKLMGEVGYDVVSLHDIAEISDDFDVEETAKTYEGNAIIKAIIFGNRAGILTLADDTGLEVDALDGRPGVYSARYAPDDDARISKLLGELQDIEDKKRGAQFRCTIAIYDPHNFHVETCEGLCRGEILREKRGINSFGYSPIFYIKDLGKTYGELDMVERGRISHRGKALLKAKELLQKK